MRDIMPIICLVDPNCRIVTSHQHRSEESLLEQITTLTRQRNMLLAAIFGFDELIVVRSYPELVQQAVEQIKTGNRPPMEGD